MTGALLITAGNCEAVTGLRWRLVRAEAARLGVPVLGVGRKLAVPAAAFLAALASTCRVAAAPKPLDAMGDEEQRAAMRDALGLRAVGGTP